jgi:uncharacterized protein (DUF305 family)
MNNQTILVAIIALLVGGIGGYTVKDASHESRGLQETVSNDIPAGMHRMPDGTLMAHTDPSMNAMNQVDHLLAMTVSSEREFIEGMIPHHQEAVDTAREVISRGGTTPQIRELVENIILAQEAEIAEMKQWYQDWYGESYVDRGNYMPMMRELKSLSGAELDRAFLEDMIDHHLGAIVMARSVDPYVTKDEVAKLTQAIIASQSMEIAQMQQMLLSL